MPYEPQPHQEEAVEKLSNGKVLWGGVGSGKSLTALFYYIKQEAPKHIYVITTAKKRDKLEWDHEAAKLGIGRHTSLPGYGKLVVDSWNNIGKYTSVEGSFFIFDEQRLVGSGAWVKAFYSIAKKNRWILLTATPGDAWVDYAPLFIANGLYKNITQFRMEHVVYQPHVRYPKIKKYLNIPTLEKYRAMLLVEMPYERHTERHVEFLELDYDKEKFDTVWKRRWHIFEDRPIADVGELFRVGRKVCGTDPSRAAKIAELLVTHPKMIVFYNFNYELEILRSLASICPIAEWNGHRKQEIPETDSWLYLVQYTSGSEGWNCVETDAMVFYSMTYSYRTFEQAQGRIDRLDTPFSDLYYYVFTSTSITDKAIEDSLEKKEIFNESAWLYENGT